MEKKVLTIDILPHNIFMPAVQKISEAVMLEAGAGDINQDEKTYSFVLAVDEIVANIMKHGVRITRRPFLINVKYIISGRNVRAVISDSANPYTPPSEYDEKTVLKNYCGMGLHFVRSLMDGYRYQYNHRQKRNIVTLTVHLGKETNRTATSA